jgi:hypothetical protein
MVLNERAAAEHARNSLDADSGVKSAAVWIAVLLQTLVVVLALVWDGSLLLGFLMALAAGFGMALLVLLVSWRQVRSRLRWAERTLVNVYECDGTTVDANTMAVVLDSPAVYAARDAALFREEELLRRRYLDGEAADY